MSEAREPATEAGRALLYEDWMYLDRPGVTRRILAIEREAAEKVLHSAAERVRASHLSGTVKQTVLAILEGASDGR